MSFFTKLPADRYEPKAFKDFAGGSDFRLADAKALAWMSQLAYETDEPDKIDAILKGWELQLAPGGVIVAETSTVLPIASTRCIAATGPKGTIIAFAGTDPVVLANWITDFDIHFLKSGAAQGYNTAADAAFPKLKPIIDAAKASGSNVFVTGHSLGGAIGAITAARIAANGLADVAAVYTIGMPRPGDAAFAAAYNPLLGARTFRLVHGEDLVATVGPSELDFRHVGRFLHCASKAKFDPGALAGDTASDDPPFVRGIAKELNAELNSPGLAAKAALERLRLAAAILAGTAPTEIRTDLAGLAIELLPDRLRDHMPDRYIAACAAGASVGSNVGA